MWEHGLRLRFPFPPACPGKGNFENMACACNSLTPLACRGNGNHGTMACACESLFPLPVEEKAVVRCLRFASPPACRRNGLRGTLQGFRRHGITRDRPKWRFSSTGTRNMTFSIRVCALMMAFSFCLSRKRPSQVSPRRLKSALGLPRLRAAPKPVKLELFSLGLWRASDTE